MANDASYYEQSHLWDPERYLGAPDELRRFDAVASAIPPSARSLLDVGTGNGALLRLLEDRGTPMTLAGLERSRAAIDRAICSASILQGSADRLPYAPGSFDVVAACEVVEHLPVGVYEDALAEFARVARSHVLVSVPYRERRVLVECPVCHCAFNPWRHVRSFDDTALHVLLSGFVLAHSTLVFTRRRLSPGTPSGWWRALRGAHPRMSGSAVCPMCNYSVGGSATHEAHRSSPRDVLKKCVRQYLPTRRRAQWAVALYTRAQGVG